ncbi:MAG: dicarboxylate/amino acid:cation symporter, partial [Bdellovibrionota bacterium]
MRRVRERVRQIPTLGRIAIALVLGAMTGAALGTHAEGFGEIATLVIRALKALATPLIFFAILDSFITTRIPVRKGARMIGISFCNALVAGLIAIGLAHLLPASLHVDAAAFRAAVGVVAAPQATHLNWDEMLKSLVPGSLVDPFALNLVIPVVALALVLGAALRRLRVTHAREAEVLEAAVVGSYHVMARLMGWVVKLVPLAIYCVMARVVGMNGFEVFRALGFFTGVVALGLFIHVVLYYSALIGVFGRLSPLKFFLLAGEALVTAFGLGSSLATLPVTLRTLEEKMKVSPESARLAACVGTNLNHDGILLYEAAAALFVAQIY